MTRALTVALTVAFRWAGFAVALFILGVHGPMPSNDAVIVGVAIMLLGDGVVMQTLGGPKPDK